MSLPGRLLRDEPGGIPVLGFKAVLGQYARGRMDDTQVQAAFVVLAEMPLTAAELTDFKAIAATITNIPVSGSAAAVAGGNARRALRMDDIVDILHLVDQHVPPFTNPAQILAALRTAG